jgi:mannose-6-phosphate isomerase-like protein (cupin superfamily)
MKLLPTTGRAEFKILATTANLQAALMTLRPGGASDDQPSNEHPRSEQWLYVISGSGEAKIGKKSGRLRRVALKTGALLVIEAGELHQIKNTGRRAMKTLNFYVPPAYDEEGEPLGTIRTLIRQLTS